MIRCPKRSCRGTSRADMPIRSSQRAYRRSGGKAGLVSKRLISAPAAHEPTPSPAMNMERTTETRAVVTPNWAMARRSQTSSYRIPQNPETRKNRKNQNTQTAFCESRKNDALQVVRRILLKRAEARFGFWRRWWQRLTIGWRYSSRTERRRIEAGAHVSDK